MRLPAPLDGAPRATVHTAEHNAGHGRYPDAIRALIAGEAQTPLSEPRRPVATWHDAPDDHEIDFLARLSPHDNDVQASTRTATHGQGKPTGIIRVIASPLLLLFKLPIYLVRIIFPTTPEPEDTLPVYPAPSYPQPRWDTSPIEVTPVRYDPHAADHAALLLEEQRTRAHTRTRPVTSPSPTTRLSERPTVRATPKSILPPTEVDAKKPTDELAGDTPLDWDHLPEIEDDVVDEMEGTAEFETVGLDEVGASFDISDTGPSGYEEPSQRANTFVSAIRGIRHLIVATLSTLITAIRWIPRILWCCSFGVLKAGYDILSEAARTSHAPAPFKKPELAKQPEPEAISKPVVASQPVHAAAVSAPYRPVVFESPPSARAIDRHPTPASKWTPEPQPQIVPAAPSQNPPDAQPDTAPRPHKRDPNDPPPVPPLYPVIKDATDEIASARRLGPLVVGPSSVLSAPTIDSSADLPRPAGSASGFFASGLGNLMLMLLGSTLCFAAGFGLSMLDKDSLVMLGVLMMIAGVGGSLLGVMLLNEWVSALRFQLKLPARFVIRVMGLCAAACLLAAFAAVTIPREHWPI
ncbi:hypothetical protein OT109_18490 [Phycisphaeraceae bacterium D3-23]